MEFMRRTLEIGEPVDHGDRDWGTLQRLVVSRDLEHVTHLVVRHGTGAVLVPLHEVCDDDGRLVLVPTVDPRSLPPAEHVELVPVGHRVEHERLRSMPLGDMWLAPSIERELTTPMVLVEEDLPAGTIALDEDTTVRVQDDRIGRIQGATIAPSGNRLISIDVRRQGLFRRRREVVDHDRLEGIDGPDLVVTEE